MITPCTSNPTYGFGTRCNDHPPSIRPACRLGASTRTGLGRERGDEALDLFLGRIERGRDTNALPLGDAIAAHGENLVLVAQGGNQRIVVLARSLVLDPE